LRIHQTPRKSTGRSLHSNAQHSKRYVHGSPHLQRDEVQDGADAALPSRLPVRCEQLQVLVLPELHLDLCAAAAAAAAASRQSGDATMDSNLREYTFLQCHKVEVEDDATGVHTPCVYALPKAVQPLSCV
jgi:hypothetical protein